ncbi:hypothetical protein ACP70R_039403 [Stipagrostis hirtigluma subsp. patula]
MGVLRSTQSMEAEVEEMRAALLLHAAGARRLRWRSGGGGAGEAKRAARADEGAGAEARTVCVTGGTSFVGFAVVDRLLRHGYGVRLALETQGFCIPTSSSLQPAFGKYEPFLWETGEHWICITEVDEYHWASYTQKHYETKEDLDKLREMEMFGENGRDGVWTVMANVMDPQSLHEAFNG